MPSPGQREITSNGLVMPVGLGDEQDDKYNWPAFDQMLSGTHPLVKLPRLNAQNQIVDAQGQPVGGGVVGSGIATRIQSGRMERDLVNTPNYTWEDVIALSREFDAVRPIWGQSKKMRVRPQRPRTCWPMWPLFLTRPTQRLMRPLGFRLP